jgi:quinol monooxygenase YgiN
VPDPRKDPTMILINVKFPVKPEFADRWPEIASEFTEATLAEPGNLWFEWSRSVKEPDTYVLIEAFTDEGAGPHVDSPHFRKMQEEFPQYLTATPQIISHQIDSDGWGPMGEITVDCGARAAGGRGGPGGAAGPRPPSVMRWPWRPCSHLLRPCPGARVGRARGEGGRLLTGREAPLPPLPPHWSAGRGGPRDVPPPLEEESP